MIMANEIKRSRWDEAEGPWMPAGIRIICLGDLIEEVRGVGLNWLGKGIVHGQVFDKIERACAETR